MIEDVDPAHGAGPTLSTRPELDALLDNLSPALKSVWAKTGAEEGDPFALWLPLVGHAMDTAGVAGYLWDNCLSKSQRTLISSCFRIQEDSDNDHSEQHARAFVTLAAALHDIGKISKPFARQVGRLADEMAEQGLVTASSQSTEGRENRWMKHSLAGAVALKLVGLDLGWDPGVTEALATIAGGHHGTPLQTTELDQASYDRLRFLVDQEPSGPWRNTQREFAQFAHTYIGSPDLSAPITLTMPALVLVQALVMMADWIASSTTHFALTPRRDRTFRYLQLQNQEDRLQLGLSKLALPPQWSPTDSGDDASTLLQARFGMPFPARPLQEASVKAAREMVGPGIIFIEDAMGAGKTEASMLAAEILAARFGANGLVVALPTQATTNAMFSRLLNFLDFALIDSSEEEGREQDNVAPRSATLLHGRAHWNDEFVDLVFAGRQYADHAAGVLDIDMGEGRLDVDNPTIQVHPWLRGRNKALLSTFVATTIDHLLMGALQMKHLALRHLGLSSKVVIFDEVHASSRFMNFFAERVVEWLGSYRVPIIMLSATLTSDLRKRLGDAYQAGLLASDPGKALAPVRRKTRPRRRDRERPAGAVQPGSTGAPTSEGSALKSQDAVDAPYPRLTTVGSVGVEVFPVAPATPPKTVHVIASKPQASPAEVARHLAADGQGNILVLTNTVRRAQEAFTALHEEFGDSVRLVHARFTAADRMANDQWLLDTYGPDSPARPEFSIVVATQVVEQSLDVDFDVLITDVAPVDLILQRIGRIHRHSGRTRPAAMHIPVCHLVGAPPLNGVPDTKAPALKSAATVYGMKPVLAGVLVLGEGLFETDGAHVTLPEDIGALVERAGVGAFPKPPTWTPVLAAADEAWDREEEAAKSEVAQTRLQPPSRAGTPGHPTTLNDWYLIAPRASEDGPARAARARVRDGLEGLDVVLVRRIDGDLYTMPTSDHPKGERLPEDIAPAPWLARQALLGTVSLPHWAVQDGHGGEDVITYLENDCWGPGWNDSPFLSGQLFLELHDNQTELNGFHYQYSPETGLEVTRSDR